MLRFPFARWVLALALAAGTQAARPCSVGAGYLRPSNFELVRQTPVIVRARAVSTEPAARDAEHPGAQPTVTFEVLDVIKGPSPGRTLKAMGYTERYEGASDPASFASPRPGAGSGACNAIDYRLGTSYLLFVIKGPSKDGTSIVGGEPFSRINEEAEADSPWLAAVRQYVRVGAIADYRARGTELRKVQTLAAKGLQPAVYPRALAPDIARHFLTPGTEMSYEDLMALYRRSASDPYARDGILWALAEAPKREARPMFEAMLHDGAWRSNIRQLSEFIGETEDHRLAAALLARLPGPSDRSGLRWPILRAAAAQADEREQPRMLRALREARPDERSLLLPWFVRHPSDEARAFLKRSTAGQYERDSDQTFALAAMGDPDVLDWARRTMDDPGEDAWMREYVVARSSLPQADELARQVIRQGDAARVRSLVEGVDRSIRPERCNRLADLVAQPSRPPKVLERLATTLRHCARDGDARAAGWLHDLGLPAESEDE